MSVLCNALFHKYAHDYPSIHDYRHAEFISQSSNTYSIFRMSAKQASTRSAWAGSWMDRALTAGLTSKHSIRLGSLSPPVGALRSAVLAVLLLRSSSTRISLELTMEGGGGERAVGGSGRINRRGIGGFRSVCCWQPFLISFRLGELSRLRGRQRENKAENNRDDTTVSIYMT